MLHLPHNLRVLDGGLATELERRGLLLDGPLWSARALDEAPEAILAVHHDYLCAGAQCLLTASYQASALGYQAAGLPSAAAAERARYALRSAVQLTRLAVARWHARGNSRTVLVAASLGPYGAALHNGAEFHGDYGVSLETLVAFHQERLEALRGAGADLLAFETVPSLEELRAIAQALATWPEARAWVSLTCRDGEHSAHGEPVELCARFLDTVPQVVAVGINCTSPVFLPSLITHLRAGTAKPVLVYPNSGEHWDARCRCWTGESSPGDFRHMAAEWFAAGAQAVGGCCRTGPAHIREVARAAEPYLAAAGAASPKNE
jgi:homocysteine S-methyltransferase